MRTTKGWVCLLLVLCMVAGDISGLFPGLAARVTSAAAGPANDEMNALSALGIDTSVMPEGFDPDSTDNPYGRNTTRVNSVLELFVDRYISDTYRVLVRSWSLLGIPTQPFTQPQQIVSTSLMSMMYRPLPGLHRQRTEGPARSQPTHKVACTYISLIPWVRWNQHQDYNG